MAIANHNTRTPDLFANLPQPALKPADGINLVLGRQLVAAPPSEQHNALVQSRAASADTGINSGDLLLMDFSEQEIREGIYLVTLDDQWIGYRRFKRIPDLHVQERDIYRKVTPHMLRKIKVVGKVKAIYQQKVFAVGAKAAN